MSSRALQVGDDFSDRAQAHAVGVLVVAGLVGVVVAVVVLAVVVLAGAPPG
jgi:hypothetical protein